MEIKKEKTMMHWEVSEDDPSCFYIRLDKYNTLEIKKTDEGVIIETWNEDMGQYTFSVGYMNDELIPTQTCTECERPNFDENMTTCLDCGYIFCDKCFNNRFEAVNCDNHVKPCRKGYSYA